MSLLQYNLSRYGQAIVIESRTTQGAVVGAPDPDQNFTTAYEVPAIVSTPVPGGVMQGFPGEIVFDNIETDKRPTHKFVIAWLADFTQEYWVLFKTKRYDIMSVIDCCEQDNSLILMARLRGSSALAASTG